MARAAVLKQAKLDATQARLQDLTLPQGAGWATDLRRAARERVAAMGLPHRRDEYWRWTDPGSLIAPQAPAAALFDGHEPEMFHEIDRLRIVFVDGVFDPAQSDDFAMEGVEIERLADVMAKDIHWARDLYGALEAGSHDPVERPLAAFNTAFATDGLVIRVTGKAPRPIHLVYRRSDPGADAILHNLVKIEAGGDLTLVESGPAATRLSQVLEVDIADRAGFHHVRTQGRDHERREVTAIFARLREESTFKSFTLSANGALTRNECVIELTGDNAVAHVAGAALGDGDFHHDDTVFITHDALCCESRQVFKKVLRNGATGVFQGKILVKEGAQKTDGYQISQALLLDEDAQFLVKPELEIYADDVSCTHGSTSGAIDETALFYLRSRGVPYARAQDLLVLAFCAEALEEVEDERLAQDLRTRLEGWLERHRKG